jgi:hypothetical protein
VRPAAAAALLGVVFALATPAAAQDAAPVGEPEQEMMRYPPSGVRSGLIGGGLAVLGISYGFSAMSAALWPEVPGSDWLYAPLIGPWAALAQSGCSSDDPDCSAIVYVRGVLYVLDGLAQAGGLALIGEGVFMTTEAVGEAPPKASWTIAPMAGSDRAGLTAVGTF